MHKSHIDPIANSAALQNNRITALSEWLGAVGKIFVSLLQTYKRSCFIVGTAHFVFLAFNNEATTGKREGGGGNDLRRNQTCVACNMSKLMHYTPDYFFFK